MKHTVKKEQARRSVPFLFVMSFDWKVWWSSGNFVEYSACAGSCLGWGAAEASMPTQPVWKGGVTIAAEPLEGCGHTGEKDQLGRMRQQRLQAGRAPAGFMR